MEDKLLLIKSQVRSASYANDEIFFLNMLKRLETTTRAREEYMDKMEETYTANAAAPDGGKNASRDCLERSKLQRYIDGAEERFEARQEDGTALPGAGGSATP